MIALNETNLQQPAAPVQLPAVQQRTNLPALLEEEDDVDEFLLHDVSYPLPSPPSPQQQQYNPYSFQQHMFNIGNMQQQVRQQSASPPQPIVHIQAPAPAEPVQQAPAATVENIPQHLRAYIPQTMLVNNQTSQVDVEEELLKEAIKQSLAESQRVKQFTTEVELGMYGAQPVHIPAATTTPQRTINIYNNNIILSGSNSVPAFLSGFVNTAPAQSENPHDHESHYNVQDSPSFGRRHNQRHHSTVQNPSTPTVTSLLSFDDENQASPVLPTNRAMPPTTMANNNNTTQRTAEDEEAELQYVLALSLVHQ